jgi:hypothetical protein
VFLFGQGQAEWVSFAAGIEAIVLCEARKRALFFDGSNAAHGVLLGEK